MKQLCFFALFISLLFGQTRINDWQSITSPLNVKALQCQDGFVYCATEGGLLVYDLANDSFETYTNTDGLSGTDLRSVAVDNNGGVWTGGNSPDGFINYLDLKHLSSNFTLDLNLTEIDHFALSDSLVFAAFKQNQDFGLIQFTKIGSAFQYQDVYKNWPADIQSINGVGISGTTIIVATNSGIWSADLSTDNLKNPSAWQRVFSDITESVKIFRPFGQKYFYAVGHRVYRWDTQTGAQDLMDSNASVALVDVLPISDNRMLYLTSYSIVMKNGDQTEYHFATPYEKLKKLSFDPLYGIVAGTDRGLALIDTLHHKINWKIPNAPISNNLTAVTVLEDGRLVAGSKMGLSIKDENGWRNIVASATDSAIISSYYDYTHFIADSIPVFWGGFIADLEQGPDGLVYCAIRGSYPEPIRHGGGIIIIDVDHPRNYTIIDTTDLDYYYTSSNHNPYMVVKDLAFDQNQNLWVADTYAKKYERPVQVKTSDGIWSGYEKNSIFDTRTPVTIGFDSWNRVWVGSFIEGDEFTKSGLYMLNYSGSPAEPESFSWKKLTGLINSTIWSIGITSDDRLFYLTPVGLTYLDLQSSDSNPVRSASQYTYFPNIAYGDGSKIRLDSRNNVWTVSPSDGIYVLLNNTTYWPDNDPAVQVEGITSETTPLLSDEVTDIAFDSQQGLAYITSKRGLNILKIPFANQRATYSEVRFFPSPYRIPSDRPMVMDHLPDLTSAKIMTLNGKVIRTMDASTDTPQGDQLFWDGKNSAGRWVETGVYLVALYTEDGNNIIRKIAVIRK